MESEKKTLREIQRKAQCIICINKELEGCENKDIYLIRKCRNFIPKLER